MKSALLVLVALFLTGCATLSPGQRIALWCNPVAHAVDLAMVGGVLAAGIVTHEPEVAISGGVIVLGSLGAGPLPGVQCFHAIADATNGEKT
jgi:hypothetical protein